MRFRTEFLTWSCCAAACLALAGIAHGAASPDARPPSAELGVNLEGINTWARLPLFVDLMKSSRAWGLPDRPWIHEVRTDALGWPLEDAGVVVRTRQQDPGDPRPAGRNLHPGVYRLSFQGRGTVRPVASAGVIVRSLRHDAATRTSTAELVVGDDATQLMLSFEGTEGGVRNVQLVPADAVAGQTFTRQLRAAVAPFGTLRLMDVLRTNGNPVRRWSERTTPAAASQSGEKGLAWEYAIQLANELDKDVWINIPSLADDDYVRSLALLLKASLGADRAVYVEYSNELWNNQFSQTKLNIESAVAEAIAGDTSLTKGRQCGAEQFKALAGDCNPYWAGYFRVGKRTVRIAQIFSEVFGAAALNAKVRVVYATQFANRAIAEQVLKNIAAYRGRPAELLYGVAAAPYFVLDAELARSPQLDAGAILASLERSLERDVLPFLATGVMQGSTFVRGAAYAGGERMRPSLKAVADHHGIRSIAYEGGPDLRQADTSLPAKFAANVDERMGGLMERFLQQWYGCGNGLYVHYNLTSAYGRWGYWGLTNDAGNLETPKYRALAAAARQPAADYRTCR